MQAGFNLRLKKNKLVICNNNNNNNNLQQILLKQSLQKYILPDNVLDGTKIEGDWFPQVKADVFISHSHDDYELAKKFALFLKNKMGLSSFIDSDIWGYCDDLLEQINDEYSNKRVTSSGSCLYTHSYCNIASQHVNLMLATALQKLLSKTNFIFFLNTPNSISNYSDEYKNGSYSPWLYYELVTADTLLHQQRINISKSLMNENFSTVKSSFKANYELPMSNLVNIKISKLEELTNKRDLQSYYRSSL